MHQPKVYQTAGGDWTFSFEGQESLMYFSTCDFPDMVQVGGVYLSKEDLRLPNATFPEGSYGVYRCVQRILNGRAREVTWYHRGAVKKVDAPEGMFPPGVAAELDEGDEVPKAYTFEFDGCDCEHCYETEAEATAALGMHAFFNRGAVGRLDEVKEQFDMSHTARTEVVRGQDTTGAVHEMAIDVPAKKAVQATLRDGRIIVVDDSGAEHICAATVAELRPPDDKPFKPPMVCQFKQISAGDGPAPQPVSNVSEPTPAAEE